MRDFKFQAELKAQTRDAWAEGHKNVLLHLPTGGGKTRIFTDLLVEADAPGVGIAHRSELIGQMSMAFARNGVRHRIFASNAAIKEIIAEHVDVLGKSFYDPNAKITAASVDTLTARDGSLHRWRAEQRVWVVDEGHHCQTGNKWGRAVAELNPAAVGLLPTACPERADGKGLGRGAGGLADVMLTGPSMRWLIDNNYLADYALICPPQSINSGALTIGSTGDYTQASLAAESRRSIGKIVGDACDHYITHTPGRPGMMFTTDIESAQDIAAGFRARGVNALAVSSKSPRSDRVEAVKGLAAGRVQMVVNVDLFGEGTDVPVLEVVIFGRKSESRNLYLQQAGRSLRWVAGKTAYIIDMVGNVLERHGLPDAPYNYTLGEREARSRGTSGPPMLTACKNPMCARAFEKFRVACPYCGHVPQPAARRSLEQTDGNLVMLDPDVLAQMRAAVVDANKSPEAVQYEMAAKFAPRVAQHVAKARQKELLTLRAHLVDAVAHWAGRQTAAGRSYEEAHKLLFLKHKTDVYTAQTLDARATQSLIEALTND